MTERGTKIWSPAQILYEFEAAREKEYRSDVDRAEAIADATERCLYLLLRSLADGEDASKAKE